MVEYLKGKPKLQEIFSEYTFLSDLIEDGIRNGKVVLISRSDFDEFGYDILAQVEGSKRMIKIQLKTFQGKASVWDIHKTIIEDEDGIVVVMKVSDKNTESLNIEYYTIVSTTREQIIKQPPKKSHLLKCKLKKGDLTLITKNELFKKVLQFDIK